MYPMRIVKMLNEGKYNKNYVTYRVEYCIFIVMMVIKRLFASIHISIFVI